VIPVLTPAEMKAVDEAALEPVEVLIGRAGAATARAALRLLGGAYGRRVVVVAGKGNNGADGRAAAVVLRQRGVRVAVVDAGAAPKVLPAADLVLDAAYGTGFRGGYEAPDAGTAAVLAVDVPSGPSLRADATITFAALKPVLVLDDGPERAGAVEVADIGLDVGAATMHVVEDADMALLPGRRREAHKWQSAVFVAAGSPGMLGAPVLVTTGAMRAGAGYVRLGVPGEDPALLPPGEAVGVALPAEGWDAAVLEGAERCRALVVGPGLGRATATAVAVRAVLAAAPVPTVVDADGLNALGGLHEAAEVLRRRPAPTVLTPHEGEFARLAGRRRPGSGTDRIEDVRAMAAATGAVVLLKGSTTVVADPSGRVLLSRAGSPRLATAGTGDVLSGVVGAFLALGVDPLVAAGLAAHAHGAAARLGFSRGLVASDLGPLLAGWLSDTAPGEP
jgi:NAD(P)H-hydrate epimerase